MKMTIWHNIGTDAQGRHVGFTGYKADHPLVPVAVWSSSAVRVHGPEAPSTSNLLNWAFELLNIGEGGLARDYRDAKNRSLSVGDVVQMSTRPDWEHPIGSGDVWYACASVGWVQIDAPTVFAIGASQYGTISCDESDWSRQYA